MVPEPPTNEAVRVLPPTVIVIVGAPVTVTVLPVPKSALMSMAAPAL